MTQEKWKTMTYEERKRWHERRTRMWQIIVFAVAYPLFFILMKS